MLLILVDFKIDAEEKENKLLNMKRKGQDELKKVTSEGTHCLCCTGSK